ncbi:MAG: hypothetical protein M1827_003176 [Pycnora praestabilis]|nr:MAG: hypothetical protein M1827_003176 [Pycnora praestabilis]
MATVALNIPHLSTHYSIPQTTLTALLDAPTVDLVKSVLAQLAAKAREHDEEKADKLRLEVELENAVRSGDSRTRGLKATVERGLQEVAELRDKLKEEETTRSSLESELETLKSSSSISSSEVQTLKARISSLEASNRDTISVLESKSTAHDRLAEDLTTQHQKMVELRKEISELELKVQAATSTSTSTKFREQSLQQEIDLLKRNNEWFETELTTKSSEYLKYRKEKGARIAELQRMNEDADSSIDSLKRTENTLRKRLEEVGEKADSSLIRIQKLHEEVAKTEEAFRLELDSSSRLADLQKNAANLARERMKELENSLEQTKEDAAEEFGRMQAEIETEHSEREAAERRIAELEFQVERLEADISTLQNHGSLSGTPRNGINGNAVGTPNRPGSSAGPFSPAASRMKGGLSFTQMYTEYSNAKAELDAERRRNEKLSATVDEMIQDLESKQPEMEELRSDHERLEAEMVEMSSLLDKVGKERDKARKESRKWEGQVEGLTREGEVLRQQLRDLSSQVKILLMEVHTRDEGIGALSAVQQLEMERIARGEMEDGALDGMTDTDRFISQHLTTFKNIRELQDQNTKLLRVTRELGDKMEGEEARAKQTQQAQDREELESLRGRVERYKDELKSMVTQSQSYIRERDMFRRMLSHRGQLPQDSDLASMFGQSGNGGAPPATPPPGGLVDSVERSPSAKDLADYARLLKEMQSHFDAYRTEAATDHATLKQQLERLAKDKGELQTEIARTSSQLHLAHERYEMLQANYTMLKTENGELQKRSHSLAEAAAKQDLRTQQAIEELVDLKGLADSMRNETANLKAEKDLWKSIERRLIEDKEASTNEISRINSMNSSLQHLLNEREHSDSETKRRLQAQVDSLELELHTIKRKLNDEIEDAKKATLRKEYDHQQSQQRIDDLVGSLSSIREELIGAKTMRDHLQAKVDELTIELKSAEERVQVLQPRPTPRNNAVADAPQEGESAESQSEVINREQELGVEVLELKRDLELVKGDLENAKCQVEQYKAISQSTEEELQSINETQDQYREETDRFIEEKDNKIRVLEQRIEDISSELANTNSHLSAVRDEQAEKSRQIEEQKSTFEAEIARLKDEDERHATAAQFHQEDLKAQAEIAQQAQQNYETELLKHAEAAKTLQKVRIDYNQLKIEVAGLRADAQAARDILQQNEESWTEFKERYERELTDMRTRREDVDAQNKLLHQQLEDVSKQISMLQQNRTAAAGDGDVGGAPPSGLENLQEVIKYLRREKEIVDLQYDLSVKEGKRMKQQLDYAQSQLDETRLKLDQERRAQVENDQSAMTHTQLMEKIAELNLFRESSVTLRNEAREAQLQLAKKAKRVEELFEQIQPMQTRLREVENEKEMQEGEMKLLKEDRDRYQQRIETILQKYDRVDPAEIEALKSSITNLEKERDELLVEKQSLKEQIDTIPDQIQKAKEETAGTWKESREKMVDQFKGRYRDVTKKLNDKTAEWQDALKEKEALEQQLSASKQEIEATKAQLEANAGSTPARETEAANAAVANGVEEGQINEVEHTEVSDDTQAAIEERAIAAEAKASEETLKADNLQTELAASHAKVADLERRIAEVEQSAREVQNQLSKLESELQETAPAQDITSSEDLEKLRQDLREAQQEVEELRSNASMNTSSTTGTAGDGTQTAAGQISDQEKSMEADLEKRYNERHNQLEAQFKDRTQKMQKQLTNKLSEGKESIRQQTEAEHKVSLEKLKEEHQKQIDVLKAQHQEDLDRMKKDEGSRFEEQKQKWLSEQPQAEAAPSLEVKSEAPLKHSQAEWTPTEEEVKKLISTNPTVKMIVTTNIKNKLNAEKEVLTAKIREEQDRILAEKLEEAQKQAGQEKEKAVHLEGKKYGVKINMTENRLRGAIAKIEIVEKAATDTPEKPVVEVWTIAKVAKPAQVTPLQQQATNQPQASPQAATFGQPTPAPPSNPGQQPLKRGIFSQSVPPQAQSPASAQGNPQGQQRPVSVSTGSPAERRSSQQSASNANTPLASPQLPKRLSNPGQQQQQEQRQQSPNGQQTSAGLPARPDQAPQSQSNTGTGPAALRNIMQSNIPQPFAQQRGGARGGRGGRGGAPNQRGGSSIPTPGGAQQGGRGRGRGAGGALQNSPTEGASQVQTQSQANINNQNAALNPSATQFVPPGNKRPRDDGVDGGEVGNGGKRARGGGGGN